MQEIHDFCQGLFGFVLSRYIFKCHAGLLLYIDLGCILADTHAAHHTAAFRQSSVYKCKHQIDKQNRQYINQQKINNRRTLIRNIS